MKKSALFLFLCLNCSMAQAIEPMTCRNVFFPEKQNVLQLATVKLEKGEKLYFYSDEESCPEKASCKQKAYLIPNDTVIVNNVTDGWACAWYQGKKRETVGWLKADKLEFKTPSETKWTGKWTFYSNTLNIKNSKGSIQVSGEAFWQGAMVNGEPNVHTGSIDGELKMNRNHATVSEGEDEYSCHADLTLLDNYLMVSDNNNCGGANVSFTGVYTRK